MAAQASEHSVHLLIAQPAVSINTPSPNASSALTSTGSHTVSNEQSRSEIGFLGSHDSQGGTRFHCLPFGSPAQVDTLRAKVVSKSEPRRTNISTLPTNVLPATVQAESQDAQHPPTRPMDPRKVPSPIGSQSTVEARIETPPNMIAETTGGRLERWKYATKMCKRFNNAIKPSPHPHRHFLPHSELRKIGHEVRRALSMSRKAAISVETPELYRKLLVVLCLIKLPTKVRMFIQSRICDADLPLCVAEVPGKRRDTRVLQSKNGSGTNTVRFKWKSDAEDFYRRQWVVLAPTFITSEDNPVPHHTLQSKEVLPFYSSHQNGRGGSYGEVSYVEICADHHNLALNCNIFAVKRLRSNAKSDFIAEVTVLKKLRKTRHAHEHLIALLATYEISKSYYFIFPWAELDLLHYWEQFANPTQSSEMETWILKQCLGLVTALQKIHRYETYSNSFILALHSEPRGLGGESTIGGDTESSIRSLKLFVGRHGDLKPENILWFPGNESDLGILKIADFGSARFSKNDSWYNAKHGRVPNSPTYQSPEYQLDEKYSTLCDVWALGCIYLEFITWYFGGFVFVKQFGNARLEKDETLGNMTGDTFFKIIGKGQDRVAILKSSVRKMIENLYAHGHCSPRFRDLLNMIKDQMLVVNQDNRVNSTNLDLQQSISSSLTVPGHDYPRRSSTTTILHDLGDLVLGSREDEGLAGRSR